MSHTAIQYSKLGPSCAYDCNWLGGVRVLEEAIEVIGTNQCDGAIVVTANLALNSELSWIYNDMGLLSPDGITKSFDANGKFDTICSEKNELG